MFPSLSLAAVAGGSHPVGSPEGDRSGKILLSNPGTLSIYGCFPIITIIGVLFVCLQIQAMGRKTLFLPLRPAACSPAAAGLPTRLLEAQNEPCTSLTAVRAVLAFFAIHGAMLDCCAAKHA